MNLYLYSLIAFLSVNFLANKAVQTYNQNQIEQASVLPTKQIDAEVIEFRKKFYAYDMDKVANILIQSNSCELSSNSYNEIFLSVNHNAFVLAVLYNTKEKVSEFYTHREELKKLYEANKKEERRLRKFQKSYATLGTCKSNIELLDKENKSWTQYFRESYEYLPKFKEIEYKKEILVAVIDTGINFLDPILSDAIPEQYKYNIKNLNFSNGVDFDADGHGTHVAGIIVGVMPEVKLLPLKFHNPKLSNERNIEATIKALKYAVDQNVDIINYSGGGPDFIQEEYDILKKAQKKGILVIAAAGNERTDIDNVHTSFYPAAYNLKNIISVGNSKTNWAKENNGFEREPSSNYGRKNVDFFMKGKNVKSLTTNIDSCGMGYLSGTSMSTPVLTGVIASLKAQYPELSNQEIINHLRKLAHPIDTNSRYGYLELSTSLNTPISTGNRELASNNKAEVK